MESKFNQFYDAIDEIEYFLKRDLIGSSTEDDVLKNQEPLHYYVMGILWASKSNEKSNSNNSANDKDVNVENLEVEDIDVEDIEDKHQVINDSVDSANKYKPSSMGLSFVIPKKTKFIDFTFSYGKYKYSSTQGEKYKEIYYTREQKNIHSSFEIPNDMCTIKSLDDSTIKENHLNIQLTIRKIFDDGSKLITMTISNTMKSLQDRVNQNQSALFQCELTVNINEEFVPIYINNNLYDKNIENEINNMLYRDVHNYVYGHGCSGVTVENDNVISTIKSSFMPIERINQMMPNTIKSQDILRLNYWIDENKNACLKSLIDFVFEYEAWLQEQKSVANNLDNYKESSNISIKNIETCILRLKYGIHHLESNPNAWKSFCFMNEAMLLQRINTKKSNANDVMWYPFQLAYILQIIPDIIDEKSNFKNTVDLLWFPTGGGKTEAYLGVSAFTIFYRRLSNDFENINDGVVIIMRYTLRLLTMQQFERASALICACEYLRNKYDMAGGEINIGLWIGSSMTPNSLEIAREKLLEIRENPNKIIYESNPVQITKCPWCGKEIDILNYNIHKHMTINCSNNNCFFHKSLPIYIIDDDIYSIKPTLLLSTIDKFARITWEHRTKALFQHNKNTPDLIIQDELHLISGPLGSLDGIYEIAIDALCGKNKTKVIASTATVKNAKAQIKNLYNREMFQFPPNGLSSKDSFFAVEASIYERPARTYIGLCEMGGSLVDLLIRVYSNLTFLKLLFEKQGKPTDVIDHFYTTVGYFNAIKDLGSTSSIISDRINNHIRTLISSTFKKESEAVGLTLLDNTYFIKSAELTSRKSSKEIKDTLDRLEKPYTDPTSYSYVLASNMLSVGIDINRLGVMTVYSQPKSNAEYIQATSRVGRQNPGLVLTMYNAQRSRDKSHYEQFSFYHKSFYKYVEATSVTPFSMRAMEKALHCVFIALVRLSITELSSNESACKFNSSFKKIESIKKFILKRISDIYPDAIDNAEMWLDCVISAWEQLAYENPNTLVYSDYNNNKISLLNSSENDMQIPFPLTLNSLRNVENSSNIYIKTR